MEDGLFKGRTAIDAVGGSELPRYSSRAEVLLLSETKGVNWLRKSEC